MSEQTKVQRVTAVMLAVSLVLVAALVRLAVWIWP
jgi:hypothetical protein